ncbi:MAG: 50S ribosomal protein L19 [Candidatus Omnitrophota bacterium]
MVTNAGATLRKIEEKYLKQDLPDFHVGDTVKMKIKVQEADKIRTHPFEGTIIRKTGRGLKGSFTVRKVSFGEGVEKSFPLHSPVIESMSVVSKGIVKRSKLYYLRDRVGKKARVQREQTQ